MYRFLRPPEEHALTTIVDANILTCSLCAISLLEPRKRCSPVAAHTNTCLLQATTRTSTPYLSFSSRENKHIPAFLLSRARAHASIPQANTRSCTREPPSNRHAHQHTLKPSRAPSHASLPTPSTSSIPRSAPRTSSTTFLPQAPTRTCAYPFLFKPRTPHALLFFNPSAILMIHSTNRRTHCTNRLSTFFPVLPTPTPPTTNVHWALDNSSRNPLHFSIFHLSSVLQSLC